MKKHILATRVGHYVNNSVRFLTCGLGISISEYLRKLILHDLESRHLFEDELAKAVEMKDVDKSSNSTNPNHAKADAKIRIVNSVITEKEVN